MRRFRGRSSGFLRPRAAVIIGWILGAVATPACARTWTILPDGSGDAPTIQAAIVAATHHDTVLVMPGTYQENLRFLGKKIVVGSLFLLTADSTAITQTVIDGSAGSASVVQFIDAEEPGSVLCGLTLTGGDGTLWGWPFGGGAFVYQASPTLRDLIIRNNLYAGADEYGGGIAILDGSPLVDRCLIEENEAYTGGAFDIEGASSKPLIRDCVIRGNRARNSSVADVWSGASPRFERVRIVENAPIGAAYLLMVSGGSRIELVNVTVARNTARVLILWYDGDAVVANGIFWGNAGTAFRVSTGCSLTVAASDTEGGESAIETEPGAQLNWLAGNIDQDPFFVDAPAGDYRLQPTSPCANAGVAHLEWDGRTIIDLAAEEYCGGAPEMGAFELCPEPATTPGTPPAGDLSNGLWILPNPSSGVAEIRFRLSRIGPVRLDIHDVTGRRVRALREGDRAIGEHRIVWDGRDEQGQAVASGPYWAVLRTNGPRQTRTFFVTR